MTKIKMMKKKHYMILKGKRIHNLCNQACGYSEDKITNDYWQVTCKNCKRALDKDKAELEVKECIKEQERKRIIKIIECLQKEDPEPCCGQINKNQLIKWIKEDRRKLNE